jgi:peptide/nickel transport system permease protein
MNPLLKYTLRRFGTAIFVLLGVSIITFVLAHSISSNPLTAWFGKGASIDPKVEQAYIKEYHLDSPLYLQYFYYIWGLLHGSLGYSPTKGELVAKAVSQTLPYTLDLVILSLIFTILIGIGSGLIAAWTVNRSPDKLMRVFYIIGFASPPFFTALAVILIFTYVIHGLPTSGVLGTFVPPPKSITGLPLLDALLTGNWGSFESLVSHVVLPSLANALAVYGILTRVLRSSLLDILHSNFITAARARAIPETKIFFGHAFKNSLVTVLTLVALLFTFILGSTIFVESVFSYPGIGQYVVQATVYADYPSILGITLIFAVMIISVNLIADVLYAVVDPRIRYF